jgi:DNA-binding transcriptional LysR family regulator
VAAVHQSHPCADEGTITLPTLVRQRIVLFRRELGPGYWDRVSELFAGVDLALEPVAHADHVTTLLGMVAVDLGVSVVPESARAFAVPGVRYLDIVPTTSLPLALMTAERRPRPAVAQVLSQIPVLLPRDCATPQPDPS